MGLDCFLQGINKQRPPRRQLPIKPKSNNSRTIPVIAGGVKPVYLDNCWRDTSSFFDNIQHDHAVNFFHIFTIARSFAHPITSLQPQPVAKLNQLN
jgi:hypothetical protein